MKQRGKVLRDTSMGAGLVTVDGRQYPFALEGVWRSDVAPKVDMVVDVEFGADQGVRALAAVAESQLAKEQAELALTAAKAKGAAFASGAVARFGMPTLAAMAALVAGWFFFNTVSVQLSASYSLGLTFWRVLAVLNAPAGVMGGFGASDASAGVYGLLAVLALLAPLAPFVWHDKRAHLGALMPLVFMLFVALMIYVGISNGVKEAQGALGAYGGAGRMASDIGASVAREAMRALSIGLGGYLAVLASLYFAGKGTIAYLAARARS